MTDPISVAAQRAAITTGQVRIVLESLLTPTEDQVQAGDGELASEEVWRTMLGVLLHPK